MVKLKYIDDAIFQAISHFRCDIGNDAEAARKLNISKPAMSKIFSGETKHFKPDNWKRIEPLLRPYLNQIQNISPCPYPGGCPLSGERGKENTDILEYFLKNKLERFELLAKIERQKNPDTGTVRRPDAAKVAV